MVSPIEVVRYRIEKVGTGRSETGQLIREVYGATGWQKKFIVSTGVDSVTFTRTSISTPSFSLSLAMTSTR